MAAGKIVEFDTPRNLIRNKKSVFRSMIEETGAEIDFVNVAAADKSRQSSTDVRRSTDAGTISVDNSSDGFVSVPTSPTATNAGELSDEKRRSSTGSALTMPSMPASPPETSGVLVWRTEKQLDVANAAQTLLDALRDVDSD